MKKKQCRNCDSWIEYIDNGQCELDDNYTEFDDCCNKHTHRNYFAKLLKRYGRNQEINKGN